VFWAWFEGVRFNPLGVRPYFGCPEEELAKTFVLQEVSKNQIEVRNSWRKHFYDNESVFFTSVWMTQVPWKSPWNLFGGSRVRFSTTTKTPINQSVSDSYFFAIQSGHKIGATVLPKIAISPRNIWQFTDASKIKFKKSALIHDYLILGWKNNSFLCIDHKFRLQFCFYIFCKLWILTRRDKPKQGGCQPKISLKFCLGVKCSNLKKGKKIEEISWET
jgi:hypothetical protein